MNANHAIAALWQLGRWFKRFFVGHRRVTIRELGALKNAIRADASFLAQGASYSYLRARSGTQADRMFRDAGFAAALNRCKWETYAAAAADLLLLIEYELRPHHRLPPARFAVVLHQLYEEVLAMEAPPAHRGGEGWAPDADIFRTRVEDSLRAAPVPLRQVCRNTGRRLMKFAPVTDDIRSGDADMVINNVEFRFIERISALRRIIDVETLSRRLATRCDQVPRPGE